MTSTTEKTDSTPSAPSTPVVTELPAPVIKVTPWDGPAMKRTLDEASVRCLETANKCIHESHRYSNIKLILMTIGCFTALVAQFYPRSFPDNRILLGFCAVLYFGISGILQFMTLFLDRDIIYIGYGSKSSPSSSSSSSSSTESTVAVKDKDQKLMFRSQMPRDSDQYTLILEKPIGKEIARYQCSVGEYFTVNGEFAESLYFDKIQSVFGTVLANSASKKQ